MISLKNLAGIKLESFAHSQIEIDARLKLGCGKIPDLSTAVRNCKEKLVTQRKNERIKL